MANLIEEILRAQAIKRTKYSKFCLKQNPFAQFDFAADTEALEQTMAGREKERKKLFQAFAELLDGERKHIIIKGERGIGKSHLAHLFYHQLKNNSEELTINTPILITSVDGLDPARMSRDLADPQKKLIYFVDDAGKMSVDHASKIFEFFSLPNIFVISCWENIHWDRFQNDPRYGLRGTEEINLESLTDSELIEALNKRISYYATSPKDALSHFSRDFFKRAAEISFGNPSRLVATADKCLHNALDSDKLSVTKEEADLVAKSYGLVTADDLERKLQNLTNTQKLVFGAVIGLTMKNNVPSVNLSAIADALDAHRPPTLHHLMKLTEKSIIKREEDQYNKILYSPNQPFGDYVLFRHPSWVEVGMRFAKVNEESKTTKR